MQFTSRSARRLALAAGVLSFASLLAACNKGGADADFAKTKSGIEYKIFKNVGGKYEARELADGADATYKDRLGKILAVHMEYRTAGDSVMMKSRERQFGLPVRVPLEELKEAKQRGAEQEAFAMLQPGDSGVFRFNADTLFMRNARQPAPANLKKKGNYIVMLVKADKLQTREEATRDAQADQQKMMQEQQRKMMAYAETQNKKDEVILQDYLKKNNLTAAKKTPSGIYYVITQPGTGAKAQAGQTVSVQYKGTLLDGKEFDSSAKGNNGKPIEFPLGRGAVIPGWDEGIALLNKGSKATILIPSSLAYGEQGRPGIPASSPLRFDVELTDVK